MYETRSSRVSEFPKCLSGHCLCEDILYRGFPFLGDGDVIPLDEVFPPQPQNSDLFIVD